MLLDHYLYFRKIDNPADSLTLYRRKADGLDPGETPSIDAPNLETIFSLQDLVNFYEKYALFDPRIKSFGEKITERIKLNDHNDLIYSF